MAVSTQNGLARSWRIAFLLVGVLGVVLFICAGNALAAPGCSDDAAECPPFLGEIGSYGSGAGQLEAANVATDPDTGHIFAVDGNRISEFDSQGTFIKAWGWGVRDGGAELQTCTTETGCGRGLGGTGAGQIQHASGIVLDGGGNIWLVELLALRVQKFSPSGEFLLMAGGEVNKSRVGEREQQESNAEPVTVTEAEENLCTAASGDVCGAGASGTGDGQFQRFFFGNSPGNQLGFGPGGTIYVGDENRIQKLGEDGTFQGDIPLPGAGLTQALAVAPDGRMYVISLGITEKVSNGYFLEDSLVVREIGTSGEEIGRLKGTWEGRSVPKDPEDVAIDAEGNVYVVGRAVYPLPVAEDKPPQFEQVWEVFGFDSTGTLYPFEPGRAGFGAPLDGAKPISIATNVVGDGSGKPGELLVAYFYFDSNPGSSLAYIRSYGRPFEIVPKPPAIKSSFVTSVGTTEAAVEASINPRYNADTTYQVEFGVGACDAGDCTELAPGEPAQLGGGAVNTPIGTGPILLTGLDPGTTYHYRLVAENEAGGPVYGAEGTFRTYRPFSATAGCPNAALRQGPSRQLPDCRAYEMVSPVDKEGGQIYARGTVPGFPAALDQSAISGEALTYSSYRAFGEAESASYSSQYLARRTVGTGWSSDPISPRQEGTGSGNLDTPYRAFSDDLSTSWLVTEFEPTLAEGALAGQRNLYRREHTGAYEAVCPAPPLGASPGGERFALEPQGRSSDGSHLVFWANAPLTADAVTAELVNQVYECVDGTELRLVSRLPGGEASPTGGSAGTANGGFTTGYGFRVNDVARAVSDDGSRIFWTASQVKQGPLYVRIDGERTVEIAAGDARFRAASPEGDRVLYSVGNQLSEASVGDETAISSVIAGEVLGFMGASADARLVYFVTREDLDDAGPAQDGKPNLYLYRAEGATYSFIGALSERDAVEEVTSEESEPTLTPVAFFLTERGSRVTADGLHAAFVSSARLTGYDNTDQVSGEADAEVFLYDAEAEELVCASCNPSEARPRGANVGSSFTPFWAAAKIPGWANQAHASRVLSEDGDRLFFEAVDSLALGDTNGVQDVYQWEAPGAGGCAESSPSYSPGNDGCIDLISPGKSRDPSTLVDASTSGDDVFFKTASSLWPADPGLIDIYDARVGGGFEPPPAPRPECEGEACQPASIPLPFRSPASSTFRGVANATPAPKPRRCRKGGERTRGATARGSKAAKKRCGKQRTQARKRTNRQLRRAGR